MTGFYSFRKDILATRGLAIFSKLVLSSLLYFKYSGMMINGLIRISTEWFVKTYGTTEVRIERALKELNKKGFIKLVTWYPSSVDGRHMWCIELTGKVDWYFNENMDADYETEDHVVEGRRSYRFKDTRQTN